mmetsp:Transcript_12497/g.18700  ORF Transcript_12497/g.18700 Transcript_12497/m.18700 type:complete len:818 (-) Transcript_12497:705-3158(-)
MQVKQSTNNPLFDKETIEAKEFIQSKTKTKEKINVALVLGTGLGGFLKGVEIENEIMYEDIPNMPTPTISGHSGKLIIGTIHGKRVVVFAGRVHSYEGISYHEVTFQVKLSAALGVQLYVITNSTGGLQNGMFDGCLFVIEDHLRLIGRTDPMEEIRLTTNLNLAKREEFWSKEAAEIAKKVAKENNIELFSGTYTYSCGPSYETPLEVQTAIKYKGGVIGMSSVPEAILAKAYDMQVAGMSLVSNLGAGISDRELTHDEVTENAEKAIPRFITILNGLVKEIDMKDLKTSEPMIHQSEIVHAPKRMTQFLENPSASINYVKEKIGDVKLEGVVMLREKAVAKKIAGEKPLLQLKDIPNFPLTSVSGNYGELSIGVLPNTNEKVLCVYTYHSESFGVEESFVLAMIFKHLNCNRVIVSMAGGCDCRSGLKPTGVVTGGLNMSQFVTPLNYLYRYVEPHQQLLEMSLFEEQDDEKCTYFSHQAPSRLTKAERNMANFIGSDVHGACSLMPLFACKYMGLRVTSLYSDRKDKNFTDDALIHLIQSKLNAMEASPRFDLRMRDTPLPPVVNGSIRFDDVVKSADKIKAACEKANVALPTAALFNYGLTYTLPETKEVVLLNPSDVGIKFSGSNDLKLAIVQRNNTTFLYANAGCTVEPGYFSDLTFVNRVVQQLGIRKVLLSGTVYSNDATQEIVELKDHINFTGQNPLYGRNVDQWGPRFPDMTASYALQFKTKQTLKKVNCLFTNSSSLLNANATEMFLGNKVDCQVLGFQGCHEVITAMHCHPNQRIQIGYLAIQNGFASDAQRDNFGEILANTLAQ